MIRSRLDLYKKPGDEAVDEDPAYQDYPDVSLQPDLDVPVSEPKPVDKFNQKAKDYFKIFYGQPEGQDQPNLISIGGLMQGLARPAEVVQNLLTPGGDKEDRERLKQIYQDQNEKASQVRQEIAFDQFGNLKPEYVGPRGQMKLQKEIADQVLIVTNLF